MRSLPSRSQAGEPRCQLRVANLLIPSWMVTVQSRKASVCESRPSTGHLSGLAVTLLQPGSGQSRRKIRSQPSLKLGLKLPKSTCLGRQKQTVLGPDGGNGIRSSHVTPRGKKGEYNGQGKWSQDRWFSLVNAGLAQLVEQLIIVEARGVEPLSSKLSTQASTCLAGDLFLRSRRLRRHTSSPEPPRNSFTVRRGHSAVRLACCPCSEP